MKKRKGYNPKRRIGSYDRREPEEWTRLSKEAGYGGNPEHKSRLGDYDLDPPAAARPGKTLCDAERDFLKAEALGLLRLGFVKGMTSEAHSGGWPQNVWSVSDDGPYEAQLENQELGTYHGYPMPEDDPFRDAVLAEWGRRP